MDISQVPIKINQTKPTSGSKAKETTQDGMNSFDQIMALFNIYGVSSQSSEKSAASGFESTPSKANDNEFKPKNVNEANLNQLESLLAELILKIQQGQFLPAIPHQAGSSLESESNTLALPHTEETSLNLSYWLQKVEGLNSTLTADQAQIVQQLAQLIEKIHIQGDEVPADIGDKIQMMFDGLKKESSLDSKPSNSSSNYQNGVQFSNKKQESSFENNSRLSLDKNQIFTSIPSRSTSNKDEDRLFRPSFPNQENDQLESNGQMLMVNPPSQKQDGMVLSDIAPLPGTLSVSEFAPAVSEWMGRFMKISNGQSGGTEATVSLYPEHLGHIEIKITSLDGQLSAQIATSTSMAKETLEGQVHHLKQVLQEQGLLVKNLDIVQQPQKSLDMNQTGMSFFSQGGSNSSERQKSYTAERDSSKKSNQKEQEQETLPLPYGGASQVNASSRIDFTA